jgi:YVTN family beta-propeller protein
MDTTVGFGSVWVSNHHADSVTRIDPETNEVVAEIPSGVQPGAMLVTDDSVWVANYGDASLTRIDPSRNSSTVVPAGDGLTCGHPVEAGGLVWVGECDAGKVVGIDPGTNEFARTLDLKGFAFGANDELWLASEFGAEGEGSADDASLSRVDPRTGELLLTIDVGCGQTAANTSFDGDELWIAYRVGQGCSDGRLAVVDTTTGEVETVTKLGQAPGSPVVDGSQVWVNSTSDDMATVVDARTRLVTDTVEIPNLDELAVGFGAVWMADFGLSNVYRVEPELG